MWNPPTPAEQELWNAVVAGVRAADQADRAGFENAIGRLSRLPQPWARQVLRDTAALLAEELDPEGRDPWPLLAAQVDRSAAWLPEVDRALLAAVIPGGDRPPAADVLGEPEHTRCRLLLIAHLADAAQVGVGAFVDVALAGNSRRPGRTMSAAVPHCRLGH
ncbi:MULTISPECIES: hypothetical protein [Micromonospora]|uniref:Uncharacterized protein n=1 Tax=Micromonospora sicca TaxID=2202420 RepID=A0A317CZU6_9ACTN|nr:MULTISPECIES: hypothetical protein [unclassified Micromonospora]MBM0227054.1 hypothetical protein [Micromonospora sp. ATA51]PWR07734.1 hypothetical protein DKT69_34175 [Micromonospora sp. 4G51]